MVYINGLLPQHLEQQLPFCSLFGDYHIESSIEIIAHTPSFMSLKDVLSGCNVEVLNVNSRCAGLKLKGELRAISLYEKTIESNFEFDPYELEYCNLPTGFEAYWWGNYDYCYSKVWR
ncbi:uncharacterized protein [Euphorbia lathyris]|uniref:uncharacterized protein isoform X2 n=1 Tax=Euphorbia lathyris TaxID=212925 RepID=UPI003313379A